MYYYDAVTNQWIDLRDTKEYRQRRRLSRDCWLVVATIMLFLPPVAVIVLALFSTFLTFMFLDEVEYGMLTAVNNTQRRQRF